MTDLNLAELRRLHEAATAGPWLIEPTPRDSDGWATCSGIAGVGGGKSGMIYAKPSGGTFPSADKALIAAMRNQLPALLDLLGECEGAFHEINECSNSQVARAEASKMLKRLRAAKREGE